MAKHRGLIVVLDTHPVHWQSMNNFTVGEAVQHILLLLNAHLALDLDNRVAVVAAHAGESRFLFPSTSEEQAVVRHADSGKLEVFAQMNDTAVSELSRLMNHEVELKKSVDLVGALSKALCYANAIADADSSLPVKDATDLGRPAAESSNRTAAATMVGGANKAELPAAAAAAAAAGSQAVVASRILVVSAGAESAAQYVSGMNCVFAAQKRRIPIDVCALSSASTLLQQAVDITHGLYHTVADPHGLAQALLTTFLGDEESRKFVKTPLAPNIDYQASCFCHDRHVSLAYVCSDCLSIYCGKVASCLSCNSGFVRGKRKTAAVAAAAAAGGADGDDSRESQLRRGVTAGGQPPAKR